jgi:hypothetical protein
MILLLQQCGHVPVNMYSLELKNSETLVFMIKVRTTST